MSKQIKLSTTSIVLIVMLMLSACSGGQLALKTNLDALRSKLPSVSLSQPGQAQAAPPVEQQQPASTEDQVSSPQLDLLAAFEGVLENIYQQVNPSVVNIRVVQQQSASDFNSQQFQGLPFFNIPELPDNQQGPFYSEGLGSGFVWDQEGHIVTNNHVVDGADKVEVTLYDGTTVPATVVGKDAYSDLAVIKVELPADQLKPVQIADSHQVKVGELAIAIGNPFGLQGTMTVGIVSALGRSLPADSGNSSGAVYSIPDIIQTDAPINPGNSGGVLVNAQGQVIGVTAAIQSPVQANAGIGFVIPSALVQKVVPGLIKSGKYEHTYLGISGLSLTPALAQAMNLDSDQRGALIGEVVSGGPADKAGLRGSDRMITVDGQDFPVGGDVIIAIDDTPIKTISDLIAYLADQTSVGQKVDLTILRKGVEQKVEITLEARPVENQANSFATRRPSNAWLGINGVTLTPAINRQMNLPEDQTGVLVQRVQSGSPADQAGLQGGTKAATIGDQRILLGGDVITALDGEAITSMDELKSSLSQAEPGQSIELTILRAGQSLHLSVTLGTSPNQSP
jgi:serine protease Do